MGALRSVESGLGRFAGLVSRWFALLVLLAGAAALVLPEQASVVEPATPYLLGVIMFGMGLTLRGRDFSVVLRHPQALVVGVVAQFAIMPLLGLGLGELLALPSGLLVGMVLVGCSPGGTASNVVVYLARGDVALSVAMTSVSTLLAPFLTPLLVLGLAGSTVPVDGMALFLSIVKIVLVPVLAGLAVRALAPRGIERALPVLPLVSTLGIVVVVTGIVGENADTLLSSGLLLLLAVVLHNGCGLLLGYFAGRATGLPETARRAIGVEVGMQNSGLAASLASAHFTPLAALPAAIFSLWHNVSGALVATWWSRRPVADSGGDATSGEDELSASPGA